MSGSIRELGPNRWQVRVSSGHNLGTGKYRYIHRTVTGSKRVTQKAADKLAAEVHREVDTVVMRRWPTDRTITQRSPG